VSRLQRTRQAENPLNMVRKGSRTDIRQNSYLFSESSRKMEQSPRRGEKSGKPDAFRRALRRITQYWSLERWLKHTKNARTSWRYGHRSIQQTSGMPRLFNHRMTSKREADHTRSRCPYNAPSAERIGLLIKYQVSQTNHYLPRYIRSTVYRTQVPSCYLDHCRH
jgi:hypothetical protein